MRRYVVSHRQKPHPVPVINRLVVVREPLGKPADGPADLPYI
jgi:hypothetical protein